VIEVATTVDVPSLREAYRAQKMALFDTLRHGNAPTRSVHHCCDSSPRSRTRP
jgi:[protein-PII] uridylyltransferase